MLYYSYTLMFLLFTALLLRCCVSFCSLLDGVCLSGNNRITYLLTYNENGPAPYISASTKGPGGERVPLRFLDRGTAIQICTPPVLEIIKTSTRPKC